MAEPLDSDVLDRLRDIGLENPDPNDELHRRLVATLRRVRGTTLGSQIVAMKFDFNWELKAAGVDFATAKTDYERCIDLGTTRLRISSPEISRAEAEQITKASDEAYNLRLKYLLAEQRERAMRKFLDTLDNRIEVWRSENANERRADEITYRDQSHA